MDVWDEKKNSSNSQDKYEICFADMYLEKFLADFAVFCVFLGISRDFVEIPEFRRSATARNIRNPASNKHPHFSEEDS